jgi:hypothetical protein
MNFLRLDYAPAEAYLQSNKQFGGGDGRVAMELYLRRLRVI